MLAGKAALLRYFLSENHRGGVRHRIRVSAVSAVSAYPFVSAAPYPRSVLIWLLGIAATIAILSTTAFVLPELTGMRTIKPQVDLNGEGNVAAWYGSTLWLLSGGIAALISVARRTDRDSFASHWLGIAAVCVFLSIDEAALIHETMGYALSRMVLDRVPQLDFDGGWVYSWMYYGVAFVVVFLVVFRRFLMHLPRRTFLAMVFAGPVFLAGALGVESVSAAIENGNFTSPGVTTWAALIAAEEGLEMAGVALFVYALLSYVASCEVKLALPVRE